MAGQTEARQAGRRFGWRAAGWGAAASLLLLPFVAMQFTDEVDWSPGDFIVFAAMLALAGGAIELAARSSDNLLYRAGAALAVLGSFLLVWVNLAVGFLGSEDNVANLMFLVILLVNVAGALMVRGRASGMAAVLCASAAIQMLIALIALAAGIVSSGRQGVVELAASAIFTGLWLLSALLFRLAATRTAR